MKNQTNIWVIIALCFIFGVSTRLIIDQVNDEKKLKILTVQLALDEANINKLSDDLIKLSPIIQRLNNEDKYIKGE